MKVTLSFLGILAALTTLASTSPVATGDVNSNDFIQEAKDFKAFHIGSEASHQAQIVFLRDVKDNIYDYVAFGYNAAAGIKTAQRLEPMIPFDDSQPIAVVDPTAEGQKGLYFNKSDSTTLTPFQVNIMFTKIDMFYIRSYKGDKMIKQFKPFPLRKEVAPLASPSEATITSFDAKTGKGKATFSYDVHELVPAGLASFIVMVGDRKQKLYSTILTKKTTVDFQLPDGANPEDSRLTVSAVSLSGSVVSPTNCVDVRVLQ